MAASARLAPLSRRAAADVPVLCRLGLHRAGPWPRWNQGYYFSRCERCHVDLVRTAFDGWRVPHGFRVLWQAEPPPGALLQSRSVAAPVTGATEPLEQDAAGSRPEAGAEATGEVSVDAPVSAPEEIEVGPPEEPSPVEPVPAMRRSAIPDFMNDFPAATPRASPALPVGSAREGTARKDSPDVPQVPAPARRLRDRLGNVARWKALAPASAPTASADNDGGERHALAYPALGFFVVALVAAIILSLIEWPMVRPQPSALAPRPQAEAAPRAENLEPVAAMVAASLLNCRSEPLERSPVLQRLGHGQSVLLIDRTSGWAGVDTGRNRCWVLERHLSVGDPAWLNNG